MGATKQKQVTVHKPNRSFIDSLTIDSGHGILTSHIPAVVGVQQFVENFYQWKKPTPESVAQFGLFGDGLNYHTYYPDVKVEELQPKADEFIEPMFRLLSATIVSKNWNPTDFGAGGVLKASMGLLLGQTVNVDHSTEIGNAIGSVSKVAWQEAYKDGNIFIPAGINGVLKIDGKANPRIARGILMEPPSIHSNSVTVQFKWDKSHPELSDNDFYEKLGTYDSKGQMIRRMVTEIIRYHETSLVSHGADPYAQKITADGKLNNPIFANRTWNSYSEYVESKDKIYVFEDYKQLNTDDTQANINKEGEPQNNKNNMDKELLALLESLFGEGLLTLAEGQEVSQENVQAAIRALVESNNNNASQVTSLTEQVTNLTTERNQLQETVNSLNTKVAGLELAAKVGNDYIASLRDEAVETYNKLMGDKADQNIINMFRAETTSPETIKSLTAEYTKQLNEKFPMRCSACGSHDISRASSVQEPEDKKTSTTENKEVPLENYMDDLYNRKFNKKS